MKGIVRIGGRSNYIEVLRRDFCRRLISLIHLKGIFAQRQGANLLPIMGCGASNAARVLPTPTAAGQKNKASSWYAVAPHDLPDGVPLAPDRRAHNRHLGKLNRFLRKTELNPDELLGRVSQKKKALDETQETQDSTLRNSRVEIVEPALRSTVETVQKPMRQ